MKYVYEFLNTPKGTVWVRKAAGSRFGTWGFIKDAPARIRNLWHQEVSRRIHQ